MPAMTRPRRAVARSCEGAVLPDCAASEDRPPSTEVVHCLSDFQKKRTGASSSKGVGHVGHGTLEKGCCTVMREFLQGYF